MKISIFGLGYVGCVSAGCLARLGHQVIGVDVSETKVALINSGRATIIENNIDELIESAQKSGKLEATTDSKKAVLNTDVSIICVGTPSSKTGHLNLEYIYKVAKDIGLAIKNKYTFHVIVIRSTILPGTDNVVAKIIEDVSGKQKNIAFGMVSNPEFLREGTAVRDYMNPSFTLIGSESEAALNIVEKMYKGLEAPVIKTDLNVAEFMKYVNNTFHALKVTFSNEVGNICKVLNVDSYKVMEILCMDKKLNLSSYYMKPGFAYGGSCLPKDLRALNTLARDNYLDVPVISSIARSNELQKQKVLDIIISKNKKKIGILGFSFKEGTDDLRESPIVDVVERLIGKGYDIKIFDKNVFISNLTGTNKEYIEKKIPHLQNLITDDIKYVIENSDVLVITNKEKEIKDVLMEEKLVAVNYASGSHESYSECGNSELEDKIIIDLVRMDEAEKNIAEYDGLCW